MVISIATFITTFIFGAVMIIILAVLLNNKITYSYIGLRFLTLFSWIVIIRLLLPFEFHSFTITVPCSKGMPIIRDILVHSVFQIQRYNITVLNILICMWLLGVICYNYQLLKTYQKISALSELSDADNTPATALLNKLKTEKKIKQKIRLIQNDFITTPSIIGFRHASILLPNDNFNDEELFCIFSHELNHYQHHDNFSKLILELINSLYWWNPLFYLLKAQITTVFEFRADRSVIEQMQKDSVSYLECMFKIYKRQSASHASPISTAFCATHKQKLVHRFTYITQSQYRCKENTLCVLIICLCLLMGTFAMVFEAHSILPQDAKNTYSLDDGPSYIIENSKGQYTLYIDNKKIGSIKNIKDESIKNVPIYYLKEK